MTNPFAPPETWRPLWITTGPAGSITQRGNVTDVPAMTYAARCAGGSAQVEGAQIIAIAPRTAIGEMIACTFQPVEYKHDGSHETPPFEAPVLSLLRGILIWSNGGANFRCELDLLRGIQVAVPAETIIMSVYQLNVVPPWEKQLQRICFPKYKCFGGVAYGCVGRQAQLTEIAHLYPQGTVLDGKCPKPLDRCRFEIPEFAQRVIVQVKGSQGTALLRVHGQGDENPTEETYVAGKRGRHIEIDGGSRFVEILNLSDTPLVASVIFGLVL